MTLQRMTADGFVVDTLLAGFGDVVAQDRSVRKLREWTKRPETFGAILVSGPEHVGKRALSHLLTKAILCLDPADDASPCNQCEKCRSADSYQLLDYGRFDAAMDYKEHELRLFLSGSQTTTLVEQQVVVIENVDEFKPAKFDIFLKTLEEASRKITFVLLARNAYRVRPTVRSRCRLHISLKALPLAETNELARRMAAISGLELDEQTLNKIALASRGLPGRLDPLLRRFTNADHDSDDAALKILELDWADELVAYLRAVLAGDEPDEMLRAKVAGPDPDESMRRLRIVFAHLFAKGYGGSVSSGVVGDRPPLSGPV